MDTDETPLWKQRFSICQECPRFVKFSSTCRECGCFMVLKVRIKSERCPLGKWEADGQFVAGS